MDASFLPAVNDTPLSFSLICSAIDTFCREIPSQRGVFLSITPILIRMMAGLTTGPLGAISQYSCGASEPDQVLPERSVIPALEDLIADHMRQYSVRLTKISACGGPITSHEVCPDWWRRREATWRQRALQAENLRLCTHARIWRDFLPHSRKSFRDLGSNSSSSIRLTGTFSPFDYFEPVYACGSEERVPAHIGDGPKWVCGARELRRPCQLLALGSNFDDSFERAMHHRADCSAYVVDPTLRLAGVVSGALRGSDGHAEARDAVATFATALSRYGATLNSSTGVGDASKGRGTITDGGDAGVVRFKVVSLSVLLRDKYGPPPWFLDAVKIDIEGNEGPVLREAFRLCSEGDLTISQLNVELHAWPRWYRHSFKHYQELYAVFDQALSCNLMLHHKEHNSWGCPESQCMEFSWVSIQHARRQALAATSSKDTSGFPTLAATLPASPQHAGRALGQATDFFAKGAASHASDAAVADVSASNAARAAAVPLVPPAPSPTLLDALASSPTPAIILDAIHGLGNRVRALSSAGAIAEANNCRLIVLWVADAHCNARFADLFEVDAAMTVIDQPDLRVLQRPDVWAIRIDNSGEPPIKLSADGQEQRTGPALKRPTSAVHVYVRAAVITPRDIGLSLKSFAQSRADGPGHAHPLRYAHKGRGWPDWMRPSVPCGSSDPSGGSKS